LVEADETIEVTLSNPSNATLGVNTVHTYTILDNDAYPTVAFDLTASAGAESVTPASLAVSLSAAYVETVTVDYAVTGGTAGGGGVDYTLAAGTLTFDPNDVTKTVDITIVDDGLVEADETIQVTLSNPSNATLGVNTVHTYTINDNDVFPTVAFDLTASSGDESVTPASLSVSLSAAYMQTVTVDYAVTGGTAAGGGVDYTLAAGTLTFDPNDVSKSIDIAIVDDGEVESDETIEVTLSNPSNATLGSNTVHTYTINDNDTAGLGEVVLQYGLNGYTGTEDTYLWDGQSDGDPYGASVKMTLCGYDVGDRQRPLLRFDLTSISPGTTITSGILWLYNYEEHGGSGDYVAYETTTAWDEASATWNLAATGQSWTTPGGDYNPAAEICRITKDPAAVDQWMAFDITSAVQGWIDNPSSNIGMIIKVDNEAAMIANRFHSSAVATQSLRPKLVVSDLPTVAFDLTASSGDESLTPVSLSVSLSQPSAQTIMVDYAVTGGTATGGGVDYTLAAGTLTFDPNDLSKTIDITIVEDGLDEWDETIEVTLSSPSNATLGANAVHTYTILDNDAAVSVDFDLVSSSGDESVTPASLSVSLSAVSGRTVTVDFAVTGGTAVDPDDYAIAASPLTFDPGVTQQDVVITVVDDGLVESDETIEVTLSNPVNATLGANTVHTYTILDNDVYPTVEFDLVSSSGDESVTPASLAVSLSSSSQDTVTVDYAVTGGDATGGGVDYTLAAGTLTFDPNDVSETIDIAIVDDGEAESDETIEVTLSNPSNATLGANTIHTYTILDNDGVAPPGQASSPSPANGETKVSRSVILSWTAGSGADSHDVYFGTNPSPGASEFQGNQTETTFTPSYLAKNTWYYWRIDEVNAGGTTAGVVWSFRTGTQ